MSNVKAEGLYSKYWVERISDVEPDKSKHKDCRYFVLDPQHDEAAVEALIAYAHFTDNRALAEEIHEWILDIDRVP